MSIDWLLISYVSALAYLSTFIDRPPGDTICYTIIARLTILPRQSLPRELRNARLQLVIKDLDELALGVR